MLEHKRVELTKLHEDPANVRLHPDENLADIRASLLEFGQVEPLVVQKSNGKVIGGNGRLRVMRDLGWKECDVTMVDFDSMKSTALGIALNRAGERAEWDKEALDKLLKEIEGMGEGIEQSFKELAEDCGLGAEAGTADAEPQIDKAAELQKKWGTAQGQLWLIGEHRLLCGDSNLPSMIIQCLNSETPGVTVIDPPFEMNCLPHIADPCIVFGQAKHIRMIPEELWRFERVIDKGQAHRSATIQVGHRHAFVAQCGTVKKLPDDKLATYPSIIDGGERPDHPHQKPLEILQEHLSVWTPEWEMVFDPFAGSGTTMVAAQNLGKRCYGIEVDPGRCAVILQRMADAFSLNPVLENGIQESR